MKLNDKIIMLDPADVVSRTTGEPSQLDKDTTTPLVEWEPPVDDGYNPIRPSEPAYLDVLLSLRKQREEFVFPSEPRKSTRTPKAPKKVSDRVSQIVSSKVPSEAQAMALEILRNLK